MKNRLTLQALYKPCQYDINLKKNEMKKRLYLKDTEAREEGNTFSVIADFEGNEEQLMDIEVNEILPILPLRNMVLFPVYLCRYLSGERLP